MIIKPKAQAANLTTANTVQDSQLVRIYAGANTLITITTSANVVAGSFVMPNGTTEIVEKDTDDTITANASVSVTPVAYKG